MAPTETLAERLGRHIPLVEDKDGPQCLSHINREDDWSHWRSVGTKSMTRLYNVLRNDVEVMELFEFVLCNENQGLCTGDYFVIWRTTRFEGNPI